MLFPYCCRGKEVTQDSSLTAEEIRVCYLYRGQPTSFYKNAVNPRNYWMRFQEYIPSVRKKTTCKRDRSAQFSVKECLLLVLQLFLYDMTVTFRPTVCVLGGDNIKLHKDMPNKICPITATSNGAVIELIIKPENKQATFLTLLLHRWDKVWAVERVHTGSKMFEQLSRKGRLTVHWQIIQLEANKRTGHHFYKKHYNSVVSD